jgi:uridine kinase
MKPFVMLVAGGSASGKSTVVEEVMARSGIDDVIILRQDDYYHDQVDIPLEKRRLMNYDHPSSLDNALLNRHLIALLEYQAIDKPVYDFVNHTREPQWLRCEPKNIIIVEGILVLHDPAIRALSDLNIYVELDDDTRFIRRMLRDLNERGRTIDNIVEQYQTTVKPMFHAFIRPTKRFADVIIPNDAKHDNAVDLIAAKIDDYRRKLKASQG